MSICCDVSGVHVVKSPMSLFCPFRLRESNVLFVSFMSCFHLAGIHVLFVLFMSCLRDMTYWTFRPVTPILRKTPFETRSCRSREAVR